MPSAIVPIAAHCIVRFTRFVLERKTGFSAWNTAQITTRPTMTGREPRSPPRIRASRDEAAERMPSALNRRSPGSGTSGGDARSFPAVTCSHPGVRVHGDR